MQQSLQMGTWKKFTFGITKKSALLIDCFDKMVYNNLNNVIFKDIRKRDILMLNVNELLEIAIEETRKLSAREIFLVKDLFKGYEWNRIPRNERLLLGTLFLNYINKTDNNIRAVEKTSSGQQKYINGN